MQTLDLLRFAPTAARSLVGVNRGTWSRWLACKSRVPVAVSNLLRTLVAGEILHTGWEGWILRDGKIFDPSGQWHTPGTIQAWHWTRQELMSVRASENGAVRQGGNVLIFPGRRSADAITTHLHKLLATERCTTGALDP